VGVLVYVDDGDAEGVGVLVNVLEGVLVGENTPQFTCTDIWSPTV
jgi:hypothetical protein